MQLLETTKNYQSALAAYCRTGNYTFIPGVNEKNVTHYRRLVYNVIKDSLRTSYPLTVNLLSETRWEELVNNFFSNYPCQSPQVWYMPREFYEYIIVNEKALNEEYPFLSELLWFEWLEVELYMMKDIIIEYKSTGDLLSDKLIINPEHTLQQFDFPVHLKKARSISAEDKGNYYLSIHSLAISRFTMY